MASYTMLVSMEAAQAKEASGVASALKRNSGVALHVRTVVVYHVILFHPPDLVQLRRGEGLIRRLIPPLVGHWHGTGSICICGRAGVQVIVLVGGNERRMSPVYLHLASLRCPLIPIPYARKYIHRLLVWKRHPHVFIVCE